MVEAIKSGKYPFVMCNFAPPDMVGHTGVYEAAVVACAATGKHQMTNAVTDEQLIFTALCSFCRQVNWRDTAGM